MFPWQCLDRLSSVDVDVEEIKEWNEEKIINLIEKTHSKEHVEKLKSSQEVAFPASSNISTVKIWFESKRH